MEQEKKLVGVLEGLLFVAGDEGISIVELSETLELSQTEVLELIESLKEEYENPNRGLQIRILANRYKLTSKREHGEFFKKLVESPSNSSLSQAALETLAIVAYQQPITRTEIEDIRGVKTEKPIQTLVSKYLIKEVGRAEGTGRAILYGTTSEFLDYFGLKNIKELPPLPQDLKLEEVEEEADLFFSKFEKQD
ncbi:MULTISPECIES: SMC-Scp complex subunit ScpB [Bacillaceae]|uniref:Segregation and condensation protein B n=1 Tax=Gottfriedia luciferensis TaxID=178774 RepID=A0ABX2ZZ44_9BACI|nr:MULTISPECIES: SMC-Scp complex subunit ScpB [Bacillaceae]ODG93624.1 SMC-Scp complex subunit ScpB [Gottfriedia luciferensis]PGZ91058.1 SMC-Scp complex subunit ScpB [Bacillus sp. AFS029533]SFC23384.1 segregation and condensation protein B [Bacillus sp. UNCCL81]